jgi:hypothetical protein
MCAPVRLGATIRGPDADQLFLIIGPKCPVDVGEPDLIATVDALGVDGEKHFHAAPGPLCDLSRWHAWPRPTTPDGCKPN